MLKPKKGVVATPLKKIARTKTARRIGSKSSWISPTQRIELYSQLHLYIKNNSKLSASLVDMYGIYSEDGKKPRNKLAVMIKDVIQGLKAGLTFSSALGPYLPEGEYFLILAGEKSSFLQEAMVQATRYIKAKQRISAAMRKAYAYNGFLSIMTIGMLVLASVYLIPQAMMLVKPSQLTGFAYAYYALSQAVVHYGLYMFVLMIGLIYLVRWSQPNYTGRYRVMLDRIWPYSLYKTVNGSTFLISLSSLMSANVQTGEALKDLAENASPYMKQRILAARSGLHAGASDLGKALHTTGYEFPDELAIRHLRILGAQAGVESAISQFADDWLERSIKRVDDIADTARIVGMMGLFLVAGLIVLGNAMIQQAATSAMGVF